jgi:hypothetical protein
LEIAPLVSSEKEEAVVPDPPKKELKLLLENPKYKFLGPAESLPLIIASDLLDAQEEKFLDILREHDGEIKAPLRRILFKYQLGRLRGHEQTSSRIQLNGLIQELWAQANSWRPIEHDPRGQQRIVTLNQVLEGSGQG